MPTDDLAHGKLLLFSPEETLSDGAARYSSKGFFDDENVPPWDTWVAFCEPYLISWVALQLVELVNAGIDANPEQMLSLGVNSSFIDSAGSFALRIIQLCSEC